MGTQWVKNNQFARGKSTRAFGVLCHNQTEDIIGIVIELHAPRTLLSFDSQPEDFDLPIDVEKTNKLLQIVIVVPQHFINGLLGTPGKMQRQG